MAPKLGRPHNFRALSKPKQLTKKDHQHYWPYIPVLLLVVATFLVSLAQPVQRRGVLAYATNMSSTGLLASTNSQRSSNGAGSLQLNSTLSAAAQAKANDMIARNYWSHTTPDGKDPWVFVNAAGYSYLRAGENLAYGFTTSDGAVTGWMNSPTHRANLLDTNFTDVGFGFANGDNFNGNGPETVVVAMYGKPQISVAAGANAPAPTSTPSAAEAQAKPTVLPVTTDSSNVNEPVSQSVSRVEALAGGQAPWTILVVGILTGLALAALLIKHAAGLRHLLRDGEKFVLHHPLLDTILVSIILAGTFLSQTSGFIK